MNFLYKMCVWDFISLLTIRCPCDLITDLKMSQSNHDGGRWSKEENWNEMVLKKRDEVVTIVYYGKRNGLWNRVEFGNQLHMGKVLTPLQCSSLDGTYNQMSKMSRNL